MRAWALEFSIAEVRFDFYVLYGDAERSDRLWVCVRTDEGERPIKWLGCWCHDGELKVDELRVFLVNLRDSVGSTIGVGPFGPTIDYFLPFEGWVSWGLGVPIAIQGFRPWEGLDIPVDTIESIDLSRGVPIDL